MRIARTCGFPREARLRRAGSLILKWPLPVRATRDLSLVFVESVLQVLFETTIRQHFLEPAPGCLATFGRARLRSHPPVDFVEDSVVVGVVFRLGQEFFV